jgi:hypothetical protein
MYSKPDYLTAASTARAIYKEGGVLNFWRGLLPRMTRIIGATFLLVNVRSAAVGYLEEQRSGDGGGGGAKGLEATEKALAAASGP